MKPSKYSLRMDEDFEKIYNRHVDTVYRICFSFMKNAADTEDLVQETFLKLIVSGKRFVSEEHEKAWLIVTASNTCKDALKDWRRNVENIEDHPEAGDAVDGGEEPVMEAVLSLPAKYKDVVYLYYYEGYRTKEIARILHCSPSTIRNRLARARKLLKNSLGGGYYDGKEDVGKEEYGKGNYGFL